MFSRGNDQAQTDVTQSEITDVRTAVLDQQSQQADLLHTQSSIIGSDLVIIASDLIIISQSSLRLDGKTTGEVRATEIVVGESGYIIGTIAAETIVVHGEVNGTIRAPSVSLTATARVQGEVHHNSFEINRGAVFHGQSLHDPQSSNLMPKLDAV